MTEYEVSKNGKKVLIFKDDPGTLTSTAYALPGFKPPTHPFLSASALDAFSEDPLRRILDRSTSVENFIRLLRENGYQVS